MNTEKLVAFVNTLNGKEGTGSHLVTVPPGPSLADALLSSPILAAEGGAVLGLGASDFEFGVDPSADPELALVRDMVKNNLLSRIVLISLVEIVVFATFMSFKRLDFRCDCFYIVLARLCGSQWRSRDNDRRMRLVELLLHQLLWVTFPPLLQRVRMMCQFQPS